MSRADPALPLVYSCSGCSSAAQFRCGWGKRLLAHARSIVREMRGRD